MAVHIRLARAGTTKVPFYRLVAADHRSARGGRFIERLGSWDPRRSELTLDRVKISGWLSQGAQPSATVRQLLKQAKLIGPGAVIEEPGAADPNASVKS
jgi:small subunit ribosomal protein S16